MKKNRSRFFVLIVLLSLSGMIAEGCNSSKKCGCGHDLNGVYKPSRRYR